MMACNVRVPVRTVLEHCQGFGNKQNGGRLIQFRCGSKFESSWFFVSNVQRASFALQICPPDLHLFYTGCNVCLKANCDSLLIAASVCLIIALG